MSLIGSLLRTVAPLALTALTGGAAGPLMAMAMKQIASQIAMTVIQKLGQQMGLPQPMIDMAQAAFANASGQPGLARQNIRESVDGMAREFNLSPMQAGQLERAANEDIGRMMDNLSTAVGQRPDRRAGATAGKSWLMAIAESLGKTADKLAKEMDTMSKALGTGDEKSRASDNLKFGAKSQEFSQFFSSANTVIKSLGEALAAGSRKQ
jgi:hypothetical protein